jgi:hypothetical protein
MYNITGHIIEHDTYIWQDGKTPVTDAEKRRPTNPMQKIVSCKQSDYQDAECKYWSSKPQCGHAENFNNCRLTTAIK